MTATATLAYGFLMMIGSATVNLLIAMYFFKWKKRPIETEEEILRREQHRQMYEQFKQDHNLNGG
jgi:hypothetical protein